MILGNPCYCSSVNRQPNGLPLVVNNPALVAVRSSILLFVIIIVIIIGKCTSTLVQPPSQRAAYAKFGWETRRLRCDIQVLPLPMKRSE
jgi:hypothetical protein